MNEYATKKASNEAIDWRIKEALMLAIGIIRDEIWKQDELRNQMEEMLVRYILPELSSDQPFMRLRASQTYGIYGDIKFKDENHVK